MKMHKVYITGVLTAIISLCGCQSLEDTYSKYAGDGKIRYVGVPEDFKVNVGWHRFTFSWTESPDPLVKEVKIMWKSDEDSGEWIIPAGLTFFETDAVFSEPLSYTFECFCVDDEGNKSLPIMEYARPFTEDHELVTGFSKMVNKYFFVGNDVILFLDSYLENMESTKLSYYQGGELKTLEITKEMFDEKYLFLEDVDVDEDIIIDRIAKVEGCIDPITFKPYALDPEYVSLNFDFMQQIKDHYNLEEIKPEFINDLRILEIDYSIGSLEDVLYFPNLEKVVLGGNRFMMELPSVSSPNYEISKKLSVLREKDRSVYALKKMNEIRGVGIEIYNDHFGLAADLDFATAMPGNPILPPINYLETTGWTVKSSSNENPEGDDPAFPELILDDDPTTMWAPQNKESVVRTHELTIDMGQVNALNGFRVTQGNVATVSGLNDDFQAYYPEIIRVELSMNGWTWEEAFLQTQATIGNNYGESTILNLPQSKQARYIKIKLVDKINIATKRNNSFLGDFMAF